MDGARPGVRSTRQAPTALLRGLVLSDDSKTVNSAAMKEEELCQDEDEEILGAEEAKQFRSLSATFNYMSLDRSDVQYAAKEVCKKMANPTRRSWKVLEKAEMFEWSPKGDVDDAGVGECRRGELTSARGLGLGEGSQKKIDERRWNNGDAPLRQKPNTTRSSRERLRRSGCNRCQWTWA